jgi:hypothetical protein
MKLVTSKTEPGIKRIFVSKRLLAATCVMFLIAGTLCTGGKGESASGGSGKALAMGVLVSTVGIPALYAQDQDWFKEAGAQCGLADFRYRRTG